MTTPRPRRGARHDPQKKPEETAEKNDDDTKKNKDNADAPALDVNDQQETPENKETLPSDDANSLHKKSKSSP